MINKIIQFFHKFSKTQKIIFFIIFILLILSISVGIPSLARYVNRHTIVKSAVWDGSIATKYKSGDGTKEAPYLISNGAELAYFAESLETENYEGSHFKLTSDIILNDGMFIYDKELGITYTINDKKYYIKEYTNTIYEDSEKTVIYEQSPHVKIFKEFKSLKNFKGVLDGNYFTIKGLYISNEEEEVGLFTNLSGDVENLYIDNSIIYGGNVTGGLASTSSNNKLTNIVYNGYVVGSTRKEHDKIELLDSIIIDLSQKQTSSIIDLDKKIPHSGANIRKITLSGNFTTNVESNLDLKINNKSISKSEFEIDLTNEDLTNILITASSDKEPVINFSNLILKINYDQQITGGIVGTTKNTVIKNNINKAVVYGGTITGGIVGANSYGLEIRNSYNNGIIKGEVIAGGIIGINERNNIGLTIDRTYNTEKITAPHKGSIISSNINNISDTVISNAFNISTTQEIGSNVNSNLIIDNSYYMNHLENIEIGTYDGNFIETTLEELYDETFIKSNLLYSEFINNDNTKEFSDNVWVYDYESLPILYIDDIKNPVATLFAGTYSWNNYSNQLNSIKFKEGIKFTINLENSFKDTSDVYYYVSSNQTPLSKDELNNLSDELWNPYYGLVSVDNPGVNVIYVKIMKKIDQNNSITAFINTDKLVISDALPTGEISLDTHKWDSLIVENLETLYIDRPQKIKIKAESILDDYLDIKYFISNEVKMKSQIEALPNSEWLDYNRPIVIDELGKYIIYAKITDTSGSKVYLNSSFIEFDGYILKNINCGKENVAYKTLNITNNSSMHFNFYYSKFTKDNIYNHKIVVNKPLPIGTNITLIDKRKNKYYQYTIEEQSIEETETYYDFINFKEIGTLNNNIYFKEESYFSVDKIIEEFDIILNFDKAIINEDKLNIELSLHANNENDFRKTVYTTMKAFNIYKNKKPTSFLTTDYNGDIINLNTKVTNNINIQTGFIKDETDVNNTEFDAKNIGLSLAIYDSNNDIVDAKKLDNIYFTIGEEKYYPENDNILRINLGQAILNHDKTISLTVADKKSKLENGEYTLKIENYISDDGNYYSNKLGNSINIKLNVSNESDKRNIVKITADNDSRIIEKNLSSKELKFKIENLNDLDVKVSLYKKNKLTAYNQDYTILDLNGFLETPLVNYTTNIYNVKIDEFNMFNFKIKPVLFESTGYKVVFLIYDKDKLIESIEKYIIVR